MKRQFTLDDLIEMLVQTRDQIQRFANVDQAIAELTRQRDSLQDQITQLRSDRAKAEEHARAELAARRQAVAKDMEQLSASMDQKRQALSDERTHLEQEYTYRAAQAKAAYAAWEGEMRDCAAQLVEAKAQLKAVQEGLAKTRAEAAKLAGLPN